MDWNAFLITAVGSFFGSILTALIALFLFGRQLKAEKEQRIISIRTDLIYDLYRIEVEIERYTELLNLMIREINAKNMDKVLKISDELESIESKVLKLNADVQVKERIIHVLVNQKDKGTNLEILEYKTFFAEREIVFEIYEEINKYIGPTDIFKDTRGKLLFRISVKIMDNILELK